MHVKQVELTNFKRFTRTAISGLPETARLVVLTGPNGSGKSSIFEAFNFWLRSQSRWGPSTLSDYFRKMLEGETSQITAPSIQFFEDLPLDAANRRRVFYIRSAYRHEPDFTSDGIRPQTPLDSTPGPETLNVPEQKVKGNYERLTSLSVEALYSTDNDDVTAKELRERFIGRVRDAMQRVFDDLVLDSPGNPIEDGTFYFTKGSSSGFPYKNLSGGEKAAFDLLLDFVVSIENYQDAVYCIDEPELHLGSRVQARLLESMLELLPQGSQLWVATHSTGMMREALRQYELASNQVCFLDTYGLDFDDEQVLEPKTPDRAFWRHTLEVALGDLAELVSPSTVFLCESEVEFDAEVYRTIFSGAKPDCDFISIANSDQVIKGGPGISRAIEIVSPGTRIVKLIDRDDLSDDEVATLQASGVRVLSRRNLESFLLSDEILGRLCADAGQPERTRDIIEARDEAIRSALAGGKGMPDDLKRGGGAVQVFAKKQLGLTQSGSNTDEFKRTTLAPLIEPGTEAYCDLDRSLFSV